MTRDRALAQVDSIVRSRIDMHGLDDAAAAALRAAATDVRGLLTQLFDEHEYELVEAAHEDDAATGEPTAT